MRFAILVGLVACGDDASISITPELELPTDEGADAVPELDLIRIAIDGTRLEDDFVKGQDLVLADVPLSEGLVLRLDGFADGIGVAVGRTCPFSLADGERPSPRLYFSQVIRTGTLAQQAEARRGGMAVTLADDSVLLLGGEGSSVIERYDPRTGLLTEVNRDKFEGRTGAAIALYQDGRPTIIGGLVGGVPAEDALLVSSSGVVEPIPDPDGLVRRSNATATALADGDILITGGLDATGTPSNQVVRMTTDADTAIISFELVNSAALARARERHVVTPLGDGASLLVTGGNDAAGPIATSELYRINLDEGIPLESPKFDLEFPRKGHRAVLLPDESVLILGGLDATGNPVRAVERLSLIDGVATLVRPLPVDAPSIDFSLITLADGSILMVGGRQEEGGPVQNTVFLILFDADTDNVSIAKRDGLEIPRVDPQLSLLCDGTVLISGGTDQPDFVERFNPAVQPKLEN